MAKINVILNCQIDNGKDKKLPGETVSMDEKEARKLADLGMLTIPAKEEKPAKPAAPAKSTKPAKPAGETLPDGDDGEGENDGADDLDPDALLREGDEGTAGDNE